MKPIILNDINEKKINDWLDEVQKKSRVRMISLNTIKYNLERVEKQLNIPKKYMEGVIVTCDDHAQDFPSAYKGIPESTYFKAIYSKGKWRILDIYRNTTTRSSARFSVQLPQETQDAILKKYKRFY